MARASSAAVYAETALAAFELFPDAFMREAVQIQTPHGRRPFETRWYQDQLLLDFQVHRFNIVLKSRQIGFSTLVSTYALWKALFNEDQVIDIFADKELNAKKLVKKVRYAYMRLPQWVKDASPRPVQQNLTNWTFSNGSSIEAFTATKDSGRGEAATLAILDEWASYKEDGAERAWAAIEPTIDIGGQFIGGSSAQGLNFFQIMWDAAAHDPEWRRSFFPYHVVPHRTEAWWMARQEQYTRRGIEWMLHQEYPRTPEEAFVKSGMTVFDTDLLMRLEELMVPPVVEGYLDERGQLQAKQGGPLKVWMTPIYGADYAIGADVAEGLERGDFSDATVYAATDIRRGGKTVTKRGEIVARWRGKPDPDVFGAELDKLGRLYRTALVGVESNNHGIVTNRRLNELNYPRIYRQRTLDQRTKTETERLGWMTTRRSKPVAIDQLARMLREGELVFYDDGLRREMMNYVRQPTGQLGDRDITDDGVMSAAIGAAMLEHTHDPEYAPHDAEPPYGTMGWMLKEAGIDPDPTHGRQHASRKWM